MPETHPAMTPDLFDYAASVKARDAGISQVEEQPWQARAILIIAALPRGWRGIGEDIRALVLAQIGAPHHPNCWGAMIMSACRSGLLERTTELQNMRAKKSHARLSPVLWKPK